MKQKTVSRIWSVALCLFLLAQPMPALCSFGQFTIRDEQELARKFDVFMETRFAVVQDTQITNYVRSVVDRLVAAMPPQPFPIKMTVVRNGTMNAFASAAGHITIFTGLIVNLDTEDELASVIAHELSHVSERHIAKSIEKSKLVGAGSLLGVLAGALLGSQGSGQGAEALVIGSVAGAQSLQLKYTRENEREADQYGMDYLVNAGFSPSGMIQAFGKIRKLQWLGGGGDIPSYLSTHPGMDDRLGYIQERIARLPQAVHDRRSDNSAFARVKMLTQAWYTDPNTALAIFSTNKTSCLNLLGQAIALSRLRQVDTASTRFTQALACNPDDALWLREYGRFSFDYGSLDTALDALQKAALKNPDDLFAAFFYAKALAEKGHFAASVSALTRVVKAVPHDSEVLETLARAQAASGQNFEAHLNYAQSFAYEKQFRKYEFHLQKAKALVQTPEQKALLRKVQASVDEFRDILGS